MRRALLGCLLGMMARGVHATEVLGTDAGLLVVGGAGDLNGDGCGELLVGTPFASGVYPEEGAVGLWVGGTLGERAWRAVSGRPGSTFGAVLSRAGDVDGDGFGDFAVGAPLDTRKFDREGRVWVFFGGPENVSAGAPWFNEGEAEDARFGATVAAVGDVDDDGFSDLLIGAPGPENAAFPGRVELFRGGPGGLEAASDLRIDGELGERFGATLTSLWDIDLDGFSDFAVGAPGGDGKVEIWRGGELVTRAAVLRGEPGEGLGAVISGVGDMDGDDRSELAVYRPAFEAIWILPGARTDVPPWIVPLSSLPDVPDNIAAMTVSPLGDFDGDGYADLLVASGSKAHVIHGGRGGPGSTRVSAVAMPSGGVRSVLGLGDVTCDGLADIGVIATDSGGQNGSDLERVHLVRGRPALSASVSWSVELSPSASNSPHVSIDGGDLDGDGLSDAVIGLPDLDGPGKPGAGSAFVFYGDRASGLVGNDRAWSTTGENAGDRAGFAASLGDVDGDGFGDLAIGAPGFDGDLVDSGRVELWRGSADGPVRDPRFTLEGDHERMRLGGHLAGPGDVNGDGLADLVLCAAVPDTERDATRFYFGAPGGLASRNVAFVDPVCSVGASRYLSVAPAGDGSGAGLAEVLSALRGSGGALRRIANISGRVLPTEAPLRAGPMGVAGDIDGDGRDDTFLLGPRDGERQAELRIFMEGEVQVLPWADADGFGEAAAAPGDVDLDGHADLLVASPMRDVGGPNAGVIWLFLGGPDGLSTEPIMWRAGSPGERLGLAMGAVGDVDGDGRIDVLVARQHDGLTFDLHLAGDFVGARPRARDVTLVHPETLRRLPLGSGQSAPIEVALSAAALSLIGPRAEVSLEVTAARFSEPFEQGLSASTAPIAPAAARAGLFGRVGPLDAETAYKVRGRLVTSPRMAPLHVATRWVAPMANGKPTTFAVRTRRNRPPSVVTDRYQTAMGIGFQTLAGTPGRESLLHNDGDPDNDTLTARLGVPPGGGRVAPLLPNGELFYAPNEGFWGRDRFTYIASDGVGGEAEGLVEVDVTPTGVCGGLTESRCEAGDYELVLETTSGRRSVRCWLEDGRIECRRRPDGALLLEAPRCE